MNSIEAVIDDKVIRVIGVPHLGDILVDYDDVNQKKVRTKVKELVAVLNAHYNAAVVQL